MGLACNNALTCASAGIDSPARPILTNSSALVRRTVFPRSSSPVRAARDETAPASSRASASRFCRASNCIRVIWACRCAYNARSVSTRIDSPTLSSNRSHSSRRPWVNRTLAMLSRLALRFSPAEGSVAIARSRYSTARSNSPSAKNRLPRLPRQALHVLATPDRSASSSALNP